MKTFKEYDLSSDVLKALEVLKYHQPTEVQRAVLDSIHTNDNLVVEAQTGSGKTASYGIPLVDAISWDIRVPQALILVPTRELALQVSEELFHLARYKKLKVVTLFGKQPFDLQVRDLKQRTHIVVATPGRLLDHLEASTIDVSEIQRVVIDEVDEMLNMGFLDQVEDVLNQLPNRQYHSMFSATMADDIVRLIDTFFESYEHIRVASTNQVEKRIQKWDIYTSTETKEEDFKALLIQENPERCIIFCNMKKDIDGVYQQLKAMGANPLTLHGDMDQKSRIAAINAFKSGTVRYLIATDVAARGLDISDVECIVNYDVPHHLETYIHRIGRSARMEQKGKAFTMVRDEEVYRWNGVKAEMEQDIDTYEFVLHPDHEAFKAKQKIQLKRRTKASDSFSQDIMKLHIRGGKKQKIRPGDIVGALTSIPNIAFEDIGVIEVLETSTYIDILNGKGEKALKALQNTDIKGKPRRVEKSQK